MSLRYQINLRILLLSCAMLLLGSIWVIWQARQAIQQEVESSIHLAVQLITLDLAQHSEADWLPKLNTLTPTRHLTITLEQPSGEVLQFKQHKTSVNQVPPPHWFIQLVTGDYPKIERPISTAEGKQLNLVIQANPLDEVNEVWQESVAFLSALLLLTVLTVLMVHGLFNQAFVAINNIVAALQGIEHGDYQVQLPAINIAEFDTIARAINQLSAELHQAQRDNRALTRHSLAIQEDERQHLAQELHDELGQSLTAIKVMAVTAARSPAQVASATDKIVAVCDHLSNVVRSMMRQLHPMTLTELGLKACIEDLLSHWSTLNPNIKLLLNCPEELHDLPQQITIQIFRVIQECLTNVMRYAQAKEVCIELNSDANRQCLTLSVVDDGQGFSLAQSRSGFGLLGMQERIKSLGGEFSIHAKLGQGVKITATIPVALGYS